MQFLTPSKNKSQCKEETILRAIKGKPIIIFVTLMWILLILIYQHLFVGDETYTDERFYMEGDTFTITGQVYQMEDKEYGKYLYITAVGNYTGNWIIVDSQFGDYKIGNILTVGGKLQSFVGDRNPGNFDALTYYSTKNLEAMIYAQSIEIVGDEYKRMYNFLYTMKQKGISHLQEVLGEEKGALLSAMIFGEKSAMDGEQKERFQKIGISHIFAISGLHISLLSVVLYEFVRKKTGSFFIGGSVALVILGLYIMLIGFSISALRAGIMFGVKIVGDVSGRIYHRGTSLGLSALCILLATPRYLYDGGFLLSFGAILSVIFLMPILQCLWKRWGYFGKALGASMGIQLMLLPILFQNFYEVCLYSVAVNLLIIPCMPILLMLGILGVSTPGLLPVFGMGISTFFLNICGIILELLDGVSKFVLSLPFSRIILGEIWWPILILYYVILCLCIVWGQRLLKRQIALDDVYGNQVNPLQNKVTSNNYLETKMREYQKRRSRELGIIFLILPLILCIKEPRSDLEITMIDVGQGDAIYVSGPDGGNYLIDGGSTDVSNVGTYRIEPYLLSIGVATLDYVFLSHGDSDHINGIATMLERQDIGITIKNLVLVEWGFLDEKLEELMYLANENGTKVLAMEQGNTIKEGELVLTCLAPASSYTGEIGNSSSMVIDLSYEEFDMLFTGDLEQQGEVDFLGYLGRSGKTRYDVLKVSHHGSKNSTPMEFLEYVQPKIAIISAGVNSRYGHPHEETLDRIQLYTKDIYTTSEHGAIFISYDKKENIMEIDTHL